jgi:hypothetical protein
MQFDESEEASSRQPSPTMCTTMEHFFSPTRRLQDIWEEYSDADPFEYAEVQLAVPLEEFLNDHWYWEDICALASGDMVGKILWITDDIFLVVNDAGSDVFHHGNFLCDSQLHASFMSTSGQEQTLTLATFADESSTVSTREVDVFWRALMGNNIGRVSIESDDFDSRLGLPSGPILSQFLRGSPLLQDVEFHGFIFEEQHCHALATLPRTDLVVTLRYCTFDPQGAEDTFIEWFRHNQIVTELDYYDTGGALACIGILSALSGNNSVKKLSLRSLEEKEMRALAQALPGNMGIEHLTICGSNFSNETWSLLCRSLTTHPRIKFLSLCDSWMADNTRNFRYSAESRSTVMNAIIQMLYLNTVMHTIEIPGAFNDEEVYRNSVLPRLEMNRTCFEVQRQTLKRADLSIRPQLLGRALHVVRYNPNLVFQFLSENVPAFVRTEENPNNLLA